MRKFLVLSGYYRHYKGGVYLAESLAYCERTLTPCVVYRPLDSDVRFVRPISEFKEKFDFDFSSSEKETYLSLPKLKSKKT